MGHRRSIFIPFWGIQDALDPGVNVPERIAGALSFVGFVLAFGGALLVRVFHFSVQNGLVHMLWVIAFCLILIPDCCLITWHAAQRTAYQLRHRKDAALPGGGVPLFSLRGARPFFWLFGIAAATTAVLMIVAVITQKATIP